MGTLIPGFPSLQLLLSKVIQNAKCQGWSKEEGCCQNQAPRCQEDNKDQGCSQEESSQEGCCKETKGCQGIRSQAKGCSQKEDSEGRKEEVNLNLVSTNPFET